MVIVRMPPSPTGFLHLGTVRTMLTNYLFARKNDGKIIFRWEDTDKERSKKEFEEEIFEGFEWLGMGIEKIADQILRQTENDALHREYLLKLWETDKIFPCFLTPEEGQKRREEAQKNKQNFVFWSDDRDTDKSELQARIDSGEAFVWRMRCPKEQKIIFDDMIKGRIEVMSDTLGDFAIARRDGSVLYLAANVIDDSTQGVTHVIRGEDHISNTPKQILVYQAFGFNIPAFAHIPLVLDHQRKKLSKRNVLPGVCVLIKDFRAAGFVPEAVINGLAFLGWNPKSHEEIFSLEELEKIFEIDHMSSGAAQYDFEKMKWYQTHWMRTLPRDKVIGYFQDWQRMHDKPVFESDIFARAFDISRAKMQDFAEIEDNMTYFLQSPMVDRVLILNEKMGLTAEKAKEILLDIKGMLENIDETLWQKEEIKRRSIERIESLRVKTGLYLWPFRTTLSGRDKSVGPFEIADVVGKTETLDRIRTVLDTL